MSFSKSKERTYSKINSGFNGANYAIKTSLFKLNYVFSPIRKGNLFLLAGETGSGKSILAMEMIISAYEYNYFVLKNKYLIRTKYANIEMPDEDMNTRLISRFAMLKYTLAITTKEILTIDDYSFWQNLKDSTFPYNEIEFATIANTMVGRESDSFDAWEARKNMFCKDIIRRLTIEALDYYSMITNDELEYIGESSVSPSKIKRIGEQMVKNRPTDRLWIDLIATDHTRLLTENNPTDNEMKVLKDMANVSIKLRNQYQISGMIVSQYNQNIDKPEREKTSYKANLADVYGDKSIPQAMDEIGLINHPSRHKVKEFYDINIANNDLGLDDTYRSIIAEKNRSGGSGLAVHLSTHFASNFVTCLPKPSEMSDELYYNFKNPVATKKTIGDWWDYLKRQKYDLPNYEL